MIAARAGGQALAPRPRNHPHGRRARTRGTTRRIA